MAELLTLKMCIFILRDWASAYSYNRPGLQIRRNNKDNLGIIFNISSVKHIL